MRQPPANARDDARESAGTVRAVGAYAGLGGVLIVAHAVMMFQLPPGCVADPACVGGGYRSSGPVEMLVLQAGVLLTGAASLGVSWMHRPGRNGSSTVRIAAMVAGITMFGGIAIGGSALFIAGALMILVSVIAFVVTGTGLMRSRVLPGWSGVMLVVASLLLFGFNDQNERILFTVPFGTAWMVLGGLLWAAAPRPARMQHPRIQHT